MLNDENGFAIPFANDDAVIEAGLDDPDYGPAEQWPDTTDADRWVPSDEDWADYHAHCLECDRLDAIRREDDAEYEIRMRYGKEVHP